ncbi:MAG: filamentous hemagglutinin N-terminal domain-containing protein [Nitrospirae bacterium]|nr:filamentous hemagglutinin N-terminal domain-containing protein [Nitrospirota bacterium]
MGRRRRGFGNCLSRYVLRALICLVALFSYTLSYAAIITDGTVGWGGQLIGPKFVIPQSIGTTAGNNLFQSFSTFNIMTGESATFTGSSNIQNVIARVTGGSSSSIDGTLSCSISGANLYLINPAGVMFGNNATLDVKGSFYVSTADYLKLSDGGRYDAKTPSNSILTSAEPSAFGFLTGNPAGVTIDGAFLQVPNGKTISIVAGDINITNGYLYAPGGQITLASVASTGEALMSSSGINADGFSALGTINITQTKRQTINGSEIGNLDVSGQTKGGAGSIYIVGGKFVIDNGQIFAETYGGTNGGGVNINITGDMNLINGGIIASDTAGNGNAGPINIKSGNLSVSGYNPNDKDFSYSGISSDTYGKGNAGSINIETTNLSLANSGSIHTSSWGGAGNAGSIMIKASNSINISGFYDSGSVVYTSGIAGETYGQGNAGSIDIETTNLSLTSSGSISTTSWGSTGSGGNIAIKASGTINIDGYYFNGKSVHSSEIVSDTYGQGNAGSINIETKNLNITNTGQISTTAWSGSTGNAGDITIKASDTINIDGYYDAGSKGVYASQIVSDTYGKGSAGNISIETKDLNITDLGTISTTALSGSTGNAGDITIKASDTISIAGYYAVSKGVYSSDIVSETLGKGNAGNINIETKNLNITELGLINTSARSGSTGKAGDITITASDTINIDGYYDAGSNGVYSSEIVSETLGKGEAGSINIETKNLNITDIGVISTTARSGSTGKAGDITITASGDINIAGYYDSGKSVYESGILSETYGAGKAGDITILTNNLNLANAGKISTSAESSSTGSGGSITVLALGSINISGFYTDGYDAYQSGIYSETNSSGNAGDVTLLSRNLYISDYGLITTQSTGTGNAGGITVKIAEMLQMSGGDIATSSKNTTGGNIDIAAADIRLYDDSSITSNVSKGKDKGGNITITAGTLCLLDSSAISADADIGYGGDITINAGTVFLWSQEKALHASSTISGQSGTITINSPLTDISGSMVALTPRYLEAEKLLPESCEARRKSKGSFVIRGLGNLSPWNSKFSF